MGPEALAQVLSPLAAHFSPSDHPDLIVGLGVADDAAVYRVNSRTAVVATCDFFAPIVDDPYTYGSIAAANAMSDVFAMGGEVVLALHIAAFPEDLPASAMTEILRGSADRVAEAGGVVAGGHTVWDQEPKFGLSVLGLAHPRRLFTKAGLRPGDVLFLTKPLGTATVMSASKAGKADSAWTAAAIDSMQKLNRHAMHLGLEMGVRGATDITGFGLAGHAWEMAERSGVSMELEAAAIPLLPGALACTRSGFHTGGEARNRDWVGDGVTFGPAVDDDLRALVFDPQTSGGLLLGIPRRRVARFVAAAEASGLAAWRIGRATEGPPGIAIE